MYICESCQHRTDQLKTIEERHPYGDTFITEPVSDLTCHCGGELQKGIQCPHCKEYHLEDDLNVLCDDCRNEIITIKVAFEYIKETNSREQFFVDWFTAANVTEYTETLTEACERFFDLKMDKDTDWALKELKAFVEDDISHFWEWYKNRSDDVGLQKKQI